MKTKHFTLDPHKIKDQDQTRLAILGKQKIFLEIGAQVFSRSPMHTCTRVKERGGKVSFPPLKKILENLSPPVRGLSPPLFFSPHFEFWAYFPPQFEFWHQNPQGKHQNSLKRGGEKFSSPLKILEKFSPGENCPPPFDHLLVHVFTMYTYLVKKYVS